jgi:formiminotetrahydrofolate cyclodeaminase
VTFLDDLARSAPIPGGGAAAAHCAGCAAALIHKVVMVWGTREGGQAGVPQEETRLRLLTFLDVFSALEQEDSQAYLALSQARRAQGGTAVQDALRTSLRPPLGVMERTFEVLQLLRGFASLCPIFLRADLMTGIELLTAAHRSAAHIARSNLRLFDSPSEARVFEDRIAGLMDEFGALRQVIMEILRGDSRYPFSG